MGKRGIDMKKIELEYAGIKAKCRNAREEKLVRIFNSTIDNCIEHMRERDSIGEALLRVKGLTHWETEQLQGMLSAMYYLGMLETPFSAPHEVMLRGYIKRTNRVPDIWTELYGERDAIG